MVGAFTEVIAAPTIPSLPWSSQIFLLPQSFHSIGQKGLSLPPNNFPLQLGRCPISTGSSEQDIPARKPQEKLSEKQNWHLSSGNRFRDKFPLSQFDKGAGIRGINPWSCVKSWSKGLCVHG